MQLQKRRPWTFIGHVWDENRAESTFFCFCKQITSPLRVYENVKFESMMSVCVQAQPTTTKEVSIDGLCVCLSAFGGNTYIHVYLVT